MIHVAEWVGGGGGGFGEPLGFIDSSWHGFSLKLSCNGKKKCQIVTLVYF